MAGAGKRTALQDALKAVAATRGLPYTLQTKALAAAGATTNGDAVTDAAATEEGAGPSEAAEAGQFMYEQSLVHIGFDIARMSMQDKHILRPVLTKLGQGSQVLAGEQGRGARILVLYHAHLLSSESVLLLQACLEQNEGDLSIWLTSEMPVPQRVRDWFVEIPVAGGDHSFEAFKTAVGGPLADWPDIFRAIFAKWLSAPPPKLQDVKEIKAIVYEMLMRNLRWVEVVHFLLDVVLTFEPLAPAQRKAAVAALAACEATAGGYTIPSYRIPVLWESLFLELRSILCSQVQADGTAAAAGPGRTSRARKGRVARADGLVGAVPG